MTSQISGNAAPDTTLAQDLAPVTGPYDYDGALRLIKSIQRAMTDSQYFLDVLNYLVNHRRAGFATKFIAAVVEQRRFADDEAEFGTEGVTA